MAHMRTGQLTAATEWRRHLRSEKRTVWKAERKAQRLDAVLRLAEG